MTPKKADSWWTAWQRATPLHLLVPLVLIFLAQVSYYYPFLSDDALISLRYAERLAHGEGLTWTDGERVEGYTDLLWILLNTPAALLGIDGVAIAFARILGLVGALGAIVCAGVSPTDLRLDRSRVLTGSAFLATLVPLAVWAIGALEHGFMAGVIALALLSAQRLVRVPSDQRRASLWLGGCFAALVLLRADGIVLVTFGLLGLLLALGLSLRSLWRTALVALWPVACWLGQLGFRWLYYGDYVPNTARAKVKFSVFRLEVGWHHLRDGLLPLAVSLVLVVAVIVYLRRDQRRLISMPLCMSLGWLAYVVVVGGDIFPAWRQLLLGIVPLAFVLAEGGSALLARYHGPVAIGALATWLFALHLPLQWQNSENHRAKTERWEWDGLSVGSLMRSAFSEAEPLLAVDAAGALPYWSKLPALDMLGLNDRYLALNPPPHFGTQTIGHELGDADYFLRREPDIFAFCNAAGGERPCFTASRDLWRRRAFQRKYQAVRVQGEKGNRATGVLYIRRGGRVGGSFDTDRIEVPAYFLAGLDGGSRARLEGENKLVVPLSLDRVGVLPGLQLERGTWHVASHHPELVISFRCNHVSAIQVGAGQAIRLDRDTSLDVLFAPRSSAPTVVTENIVIERADSREPSHYCSRGQPRVDARYLGDPAPGAHWLAPPAFAFGASGMQVDLELRAEDQFIEIAADNNDELLVKRYDDGDQPLEQWLVPTVAEPGIRSRFLALSSGTGTSRKMTLEIKGQGGDGRFSVRSVRGTARAPRGSVAPTRTSGKKVRALRPDDR